MAPTVFMDREHQPTPAEIAAALELVAPFWESLTTYVEESYGIAPAYNPPSKNYGWDVKYRKGGRTLVTLTPDRGRFTALVVLGEAEARAAQSLELGEHVRHVFDEAEPLHDGRWLFVPIECERDVRDLEALLAVKRPLRAAATPAT